MPLARADRKAETRERVLQTAARAVRAEGYERVGVAEVMKRAGLTHGGFYAHFESKTDLLAQAVEHAGLDTLASLEAVLQTVPREQRLQTLAQAYLSSAHCQAVDRGCPIAALGADSPRQAEPVRKAMAARATAFTRFIEAQWPDAGSPETHRRALAVAASLVGAMVLARAVDRPKLAQEILDAVKERLSTAPP